MKAMCPRCQHIIYTYSDKRLDLSPEHANATEGHPRAVCEYDGAECVSVPGNDTQHECRNCTKMADKLVFVKCTCPSTIMKDGRFKGLKLIKHQYDCPNVARRVEKDQLEASEEYMRYDDLYEDQS